MHLLILKHLRGRRFHIWHCLCILIFEWEEFCVIRECFAEYSV